MILLLHLEDLVVVVLILGLVVVVLILDLAVVSVASTMVSQTSILEDQGKHVYSIGL